MGRTLKPTAPRWVLLGDALEVVGRDQEAVSAYKEALEFEPDNDEALFNLGMLERDFDPDKAEKNFQQILTHHPEHSLALRELGMSAYRNGDHVNAIDLLKHSLNVRDIDPWSHYYLYCVYEAIDENGEAQTHLRRASKLDPDVELFHKPLKKAQNGTGNNVGTIDFYRT